jgi:hypothetical protein
MADPIVHITNGIPDAGTGNITTIGQTLLDGANVTYGASSDVAVTAGAAGSISAKLRSISRDLVGGIVLQPGANVIGAVTQSGGPWTVSGTLAATQSGAWNITNITGTISLPTGAATSALQPSNVAIASTTAGQTGNLSMGATSTAAPSYSTGQSNPISLTTNGALRVDGSGVTQTVSGTVAISGTVAATQSGTWTMQPGNTANTTPWLITIQQGGNAATVSAGGALKVDGSGVTQPVSAASLPLPSGAATAALQPTNAGQGSTTSGQTGPLVQGAVTTAAPTYTNGTTSPLSITVAGAIRVDGSAATQPVSGTVAATQSGTWNQRLQDGSGNAISSDARGSARPLAVEILDASGNQITSFGAGSGPSFGSAFPSTGTAVGAKDSAGVNMQPLNLNASGALKVDGSATTQPVSGTFWQATQPVSGTFWQATQPVSAASLPLPSGASTAANQPTNAAIGSTTSGQTGNLSLGAVTTSAPGYVNGQSDPLSLTTTGALRVDGSAVTQPISGSVSISGTVAATQSGTWNITNISGTVSLPTGAATSALQPTNAALGSTTSGQTGNLAFGAVTTGAPAYTTAQSNALSLTTAGALRTDASATTQPVSGTVTASQGGTWTVQPGNTANTTPWLTSINQGGNTASVTASSALKVDNSAVTQPVSGTVTANQGGNWTSRIVGNAGAVLDFAGQNAAAPANSILIGGEFNTTPTTISSGNASPLQLDNSGNLKVNVVAGGSAGGGTSSSFGSAVPASGTAAGFSDGANMQMGHVWDGDSGAGIQWTQGVLLKTPASGGAVDIGVASTPLRVDPTGTTTQPVSGTVTVQQSTAANLKVDLSGTGANTTALKVDGSAVTQPVSGTITANQGGAPWTATIQQGGNNATVSAAGALKVDGSAVTQPVSGTFWQATQPVSGTVTANIGTSGSLALESGGNLASIKTDVDNLNLAQASTTSGQKGNLSFGAVTTAAPSYTTAQSNPLSLTTAGALRVDGSGATQPVSGTVTANQGGTWNVTNISGTISLPTGASTSANQPSNAGQGSTTSGQTGTLAMGAVTTGNPSYTTGQTSPLSLDTSGAVRVNVIAGSGGGGTSSSYGSAFPATGTAIGVKDSAGTNMTFLQVNASNALKVDGSAVTQPVSGTFWQATQPISAASLPLPTGAATAANQTSIQGVIGAATAPASMSVIGGVFNTTKPTLTNGQSSALQANASGSLLVDGSAVTQPVSGSVSITGTATVSGTVTANQGGAPWTMKPDGTAWAMTSTSANVNVTNASIAVTGTFFQATQPVSIAADVNVKSSTAPVSTMNSASANSGTTAALAGVFDDATPTAITENSFGYVRISANRNLYGTIRDAAGNERGVNVTAGNALTVDASATTQPVSIAAAVTVQQSTAANLKGQFDPLTPASWALGSSTQNSATVGTGQLILGQFNTSPSAITSGNMSPLQLNGSGSLRVDGSAVTQPVSGTVTAAQGTAANLNATVVGTGTFAVQAAQSGTWTVQQGTPPWTVNGDTASGTTDANNPVKIGGVARTANPTAVTAGQRVNSTFDKLGKQVVIGALREVKGVQKTSITTTAETTVVTAGAAGVFNDVYAIVVTNKSATAVFVDFKDATAGTTRMTLAAPAGDTRGFTVPVDSAMVQAVAANNWTATLSGAATSIEITMLYVSNT